MQKFEIESAAREYTNSLLEVLAEEFKNGELSKDMLEAETFAKSVSNIKRRGELVPDLTEEQMREALETSARFAIQENLGSLVDKGIIQATLTGDLDIAYSLTPLGKEITKEMKG